MPIYLKTSFQFDCPITKKDIKGIEDAIKNQKIYVVLNHEETLISLWIFPKDCTEGSIEFSISEEKLRIKADFKAKTKLAAKDLKEISGSGSDYWHTGEICAGPLTFYVEDDSSKQIPVNVAITDKK